MASELIEKDKAQMMYVRFLNNQFMGFLRGTTTTKSFIDDIEREGFLVGDLTLIGLRRDFGLEEVRVLP